MASNSESSTTENVESVETISETSSTTTSTSTLIAPENEETTEETTDTFLLRFSLTCKPFGLPDLPGIAFEAIRYFDDPMLNLTYRDYGSEIVYKFEVNKEWPKYGNALTFIVEGKTYNVDLEPYEVRTFTTKSRDNRENSVLLTFQGAGGKAFNHISMDYFDKVIQNSLGFILEKPTERQKFKRTQIFNANRYCVIRKPDNLASIPDFLPIEDPIKKKVHHIKIGYDGKLYNCGRCMTQHGRRCPMLEDFYAAKKERERMEREEEIKTKLISDSTLRNVDQLGLRADVMTMSGGGLGQVVQAAIDDPGTKDKSHVVLIGGANDIKNHSYENDAEFVENVCTTISKIHDLANNEKEKKFTLVNSHPKTNDDIIKSPEEIIETTSRQIYLHKKLQEEVAKLPNLDPPITNVDIIDVEYEIDDTGHPTIEGTAEILQTLNDFMKLEQNLIWNTEFSTTANKYKGVQSIYRYGCNHCSGFGQSVQYGKYRNGNVCDECMDLLRANAPLRDFSLMDTIRKEVTSKLENPTLTRAAPDEEEEENTRKKKVQRLNVEPTNENEVTNEGTNEVQDVEMPDQV